MSCIFCHNKNNSKQKEKEGKWAPKNRYWTGSGVGGLEVEFCGPFTKRVTVDECWPCGEILLESQFPHLGGSRVKCLRAWPQTMTAWVHVWPTVCVTSGQLRPLALFSLPVKWGQYYLPHCDFVRIEQVDLCKVLQNSVWHIRNAQKTVAVKMKGGVEMGLELFRDYKQWVIFKIKKL